MFKRIKLVMGLAGLGMIFTNITHASDSDAAQAFKFNFATDKPLVYSVKIVTRQMNDSTIGTRSSLTRNTVETRYKFRLIRAAGAQTNGTMSVYFHPFDFEQDIDNVSQQGHGTIAIRGLNILVKQDGIVVVDTENNIGFTQARTMKQIAYPSMLSGYMHFDATGSVKTLGGDPPFIDTWTENLKNIVGLFYIVFPTNALAVRDTWTNILTLKSVNGTVFNGDGMSRPFVFDRELDSPPTGGGNTAPAPCFKCYEVLNLTDYGGYFEQNGQRTSIAIPESSESSEATFHFDPQLGCVTDVKMTSKTQSTTKAVVQNSSNVAHINMDSDITIKLLPP
jgi:hypothetical protein